MADRIIVVDDEREIADLIGLYLENDGYEVHKFLNGADALSFVEKCEPALAVLDVMLPDTDGFALLRKMREKHDFPIIMLTARVTDSDKILGLTIGADDYITKPFGAGELLARIRTAIRHTRTGLANETIATTGKFKSGDLEIDYDKHQVLVEGKNVGLTQNEYKIVALLGKCAGKVLTYDYIIKELWGPGTRGNNQSLRVHMANIRRKIEKSPAEPQYIFTEIGVGYRMVEGD